ncbi:phage holin family protein [Nonomuraea sp. NPDC050310]|uniref:phage holin family protein n=1 Tax=unclassified Nonomuraea TaxID=2593643 RepID=UPI0033E94212
MRTLLKILIVAASLGVATMVVDGIDVDARSTTGAIATLLGVALVFGLVNAVLKPLIHVLGCAFYVLTLGLFALVVNAGLLLLTDWVAGLLRLPFHVSGFWPALWGALIIGVVSWALSLVLQV